MIVMRFLDAFRRSKPRRGGFNNAVAKECSQPWSGGDGIDMNHAVIINARNWRKGLPAEYAFLSSLHGLRSHDWFIESQEIRHANDRNYEIWIIRTSEGARLRYYFDITSFHG
jgi:hypothetical protein